MASVSNTRAARGLRQAEHCAREEERGVTLAGAADGARHDAERVGGRHAGVGAGSGD
eukprot:CAMPEP_0181246152 /NCGR_PEP_ID=MMETSP1096-20121128/43850_1 /TAXON_ID=156174 ORGANISM="Chrysochromulina ericina, Strain CCMP281" /NCGR_SAMPLE_ID=MMETSP1096 /ASSEMBLY_ACC=CAM_ASM_000453 /LENGTH=56 /DNA_ID=CAMNT_0023342967 /DNA_START=359 /DNA_END=529 /DNA_ORIENTATION=+